MVKKRGKSIKKVIEASMAVAIGTKLCEPAVIPMYPITPQTHVVERLADFINDGEMNCEMIHVESEHSAISATIGVSAAGSRVFTATASQGLALMHEILHVISGMRLPVVMAVVNRALSAPINIWNDHQDSVSARDTGWIQLYVESAQEALDTMIMAYKIAEDHKILMPTMVCIDGFTLSHVYEPVEIPIQAQVRKFLPRFKPFHILDPKRPITMGPVGFPNSFMEFKKQEQNAMDMALKIIPKVNREFKKRFSRGYGDGLIETYNMKGAQIAVVAMGTICSTTRVVVDELKKKGKKVGMIKIKCYRPFPAEQLRKITKGIKFLQVIDRNISLGYQGALATDIRNALFDNKKIKVNGFIAGLGGRDVKPEDILKIINSRNKESEWINVKA
jgi:pyruvate ferredoxin oxidoreductase alpha subunit